MLGGESRGSTKRRRKQEKEEGGERDVIGGSGNAGLPSALTMIKVEQTGEKNGC